MSFSGGNFACPLSFTMWPFGSFLRSQYGILCFNWQDGLNVNDEIQKVLSKYEELKTPSVVPAVPEPALIPVTVEPDSPINAKEDALIRKPAGQQGGTPGGSNDDLMDDLDEMIFGKKGGSASEGAQDPKKDQLSKDDLITF
ncbi:hypothetical protein OIU84_017513 [Salix udensis]|uniref:Uncharacterized protein n=1 Tax=Salix udensis TaxID=889485 RepID=A0AAD6L483_9ROSI|nr:hypothetical protein OIU84_017513 [Salix udensis]